MFVKKTSSFLLAAILAAAVFGASNAFGQTPAPTPETKDDSAHKNHKMVMPSPTPTPETKDDSEHKNHKMVMPSPTPTPEIKDDSAQKNHKMVMPTPTPTPETKDDSSRDSHDMEMKETNSEPNPVLRDPVVLPEPGSDFPPPLVDNASHSLVLIELLEYDASTEGDNALNWDMIGWYGGDYNRFWFRSEGEISQASHSNGKIELQGLYGRMIAPFYDFQVGLRYDRKWNGSENVQRFHAVVGLTGLVPYEYEVEPLLFVSDKGDVSFRFTGVKDILITQRTVFEGRYEVNAAIQKVESFGVGSGLNDMKFGFRFRREITREFAPYIGVSYKRLFGQTADFARFEGESADRLSFVAGVRMWF